MAGVWLEIAGKKVKLEDNGDGTYSLATSSTGGSGTEFAEDAVHTSGDKGVMALAVRKNTAAALAGSDGDYSPLIVDTNGKLYVNVAALGQAAKTASLPVAIASDQEARPWAFLGEQAISGGGAQTATLPEGTTIVALTAETATIRWKVNATASINSFPVAAGAVHVVGPLSPFTSFTLFNSGGSSVGYLQYYKEA